VATSRLYKYHHIAREIAGEISRGYRGDIARVSRGYRGEISREYCGEEVARKLRGSCEEVVCNGDVTHGSSREVAGT